jgi:hypothetical protein
MISAPFPFVTTKKQLLPLSSGNDVRKQPSMETPMPTAAESSGSSRAPWFELMRSPRSVKTYLIGNTDPNEPEIGRQHRLSGSSSHGSDLRWRGTYSKSWRYRPKQTTTTPHEAASVGASFILMRAATSQCDSARLLL